MTRHEHSLGWHCSDLSDFELRLVVTGEPIVLKNSRNLILIHGRPMSLPSSAAKRYLQSAAEQLQAQWGALFRAPIPKHIEINAAIRTYLPTRRLADASNLYEAPQDALKAHTRHCNLRCRTHAGVIVDDVQIRTHDGSDRLYDREQPRVEITLTPYRGVARSAG